MTDGTKPEPVVVKTVGDIESSLRTISELNGDIERLNTLEALLKKKINGERQPLVARRQAHREAIATYVSRRRASWLRRFGIVAKLENGTIKWHVIGASLVTPKNEQVVIDTLLKMRGGKRYIVQTPSIDRDALKSASPRLLRKLAHLGVYRSRHESLLITAKGEKDPTRLRHFRYPRREK